MIEVPVAVDDATLRWLLEIAGQKPSIVPRLPASKHLRLLATIDLPRKSAALLVETEADVDALLAEYEGERTLWWVVPASAILELCEPVGSN